MATLMTAIAGAVSSGATALGVGGAAAHTIGTIGAYGAVGAAGAGALKSMRPKIPGATKPKAMPTPDDEAMRSAKRQSLAKQKQRGGRKASIMTSALSEGKLGG